jgi:hypothetical protein
MRTAGVVAYRSPFSGVDGDAGTRLPVWAQPPMTGFDCVRHVAERANSETCCADIKLWTGESAKTPIEALRYGTRAGRC